MTHFVDIRGLYAITDSNHQTCNELTTKIAEAIKGGASMVQYRDKSNDYTKRKNEALALQQLCQRNSVPLIINDDLALTREVGAAGIHLGRNDASIQDARQSLGEQAIIGYSCYADIDRGFNAQQQDADYLAFGSVFASSTKPDASRVSMKTLREVCSQLSLPIIAIGGILAKDCPKLLICGVDSVAVVSGLFSHSNIRSAAESYANHFRNSEYE